MNIISVIVTIAVVGFLLYLINKFLPMEGNVKQLLNIAVIVILVIWLLTSTGLLSGLYAVRI